MKLSHRRKRDHKYKVRRHAWKIKRETCERRMYKESREAVNHTKHRLLAMGVGSLGAAAAEHQAMTTMAIIPVSAGIYRTMIKTAFLDGYDRVMNDRRYDKVFKSMTLDRKAAREEDFAVWQRWYESVGAINLQCREGVEHIQLGNENVGGCLSRMTKGSLWARLKDKFSWLKRGNSNDCKSNNGTAPGNTAAGAGVGCPD